MGANGSVAAVKAVRDEVLAAHRLIRRVRLLGFGDGHARDAQVEWQNGINGAAEAQLYRAAHLAGIRAGRHDSAECADVEETFAHLGPSSSNLLSVGLLLFRLRINFVAERLVSFGDAVVQHRALLDEDPVAR